MPRASWRGFLRLSLVSCPVYLVAGDDTHETHSLAARSGMGVIATGQFRSAPNPSE